MKMSLKEKIYGLIEENSVQKSRANRIFEICIIAIIILSILELILESFDGFEHRFHYGLFIFESLAITVFSVEYLLRLWTADLKYKNSSALNARFKFIFSFGGIIDLLAILPFYLPLIFTFDLRFIRSLRMFRLLRILKLNRHTKALNLVATVFKEKSSELLVTSFVTMMLILISSILMYNIEKDIQPDKFPDIISTFWWSIATLTTVGYGDVYPLTAFGKLVSSVIAVLGIGLVALPTGILSAGFIEKIKPQKNANRCQNCGELNE